MRPEIRASKSDISTETIREYWENNPLLSLEIKDGYGESSFFKELDRLKFEDIEPYTLSYWNFGGYAGKKVLDIGCGPGWYTVNYARGKAEVVGVDLTEKAVELASKFLNHENLDNGRVEQADAQNLPFEDNRFDLVASSGVLHHVPDIMSAFREVKRVLKPDGEAKITLYYTNYLLRNKIIFKLMLFMLRIFNVKHHDVVSGKDPKSPEEFVRMYDGKDNPLGVAKTDIEWRNMFQEAGFKVLSSEVHFFPIRFIGNQLFFRMLRKFFDSNFGFLIYYRLKPLY